MIDSSILKVQVAPKYAPTKVVDLSWSTTAIDKQTITIQLIFASLNSLTESDVLSLMFLKPDIFYNNSNLSTHINV